MLDHVKTLALAGLFYVGNKALSLYRIELGEDDLQAIIAEKFPIEKEKYLFALTLFDPVVKLQETPERIGIEFTIQARAPGGVQVQWRSRVDGRLHYDRDNAQFYLLDLTIQNHFPDALRKVQVPLQNFLESLLNAMLVRIPLYRLDDQSLRHVLTRVLLKTVRVRENRLVIELGLY